MDALFSSLPTILVIFMSILALIEAIIPPATPRAKRIWIVAIVILGLLASAGTVWQQSVSDAKQKEADNKTEKFLGEIDQIKALIPSKSNSTPDEILSAAATKILEQDKRIADLEKKTADRTMPEQLTSDILKVLRNAGVHTASIGYDGNGDDAEQVRFSEKIRRIFVDAGWQPPPVGGRIDLTRPALIGVHFYVKDPTHPPSYFVELFNLFDKAGMVAERVLNYAQYLPDNESITIIAGHKPNS